MSRGLCHVLQHLNVNDVKDANALVFLLDEGYFPESQAAFRRFGPLPMN